MPSELYIGGGVHIYTGVTTTIYPMFQASSAYLSTSTGTTYFGLTGRAAGGTETVTTLRWMTPGVISNLYVHTSAAPGTDSSWTFNLRRDGGSTDLSVVISNTETDDSDLVGSISISASDIAAGNNKLSMEVVTDATGAAIPASTLGSWYFTFEPTTAGQFPIGATTEAQLSVIGDAVQYIGVTGNGANLSSTEFDAQGLFSCAGVLQDLRVYLDAAPGTGATRTFLVRRRSWGGSDSDTTSNVALTGTGTGEGAGWGSFDDTVTVTAGDMICFRMTNSTTAPAASRVKIAGTFVPTTAGNFPMISDVNTNLSVSAVRYGAVYGGGAYAAAVGNVTQRAAVAFTVKEIWAVLSAAPQVEAGTQQYTFQLLDGNPSVTIAEDATYGNTTGVTTNISQGGSVYITATPSGTPTAVKVSVGLLGYVAS